MGLASNSFSKYRRVNVWYNNIMKDHVKIELSRGYPKVVYSKGGITHVIYKERNYTENRVYKLRLIFLRGNGDEYDFLVASFEYDK